MDNTNQNTDNGTLRLPRNTRDFDSFLKNNQYVVCATSASLLSTFAGYPLDSLKSRLQASRVPVTVPRLAATIFREEGIGGFYRGLWIPLVTISAVRAASFTIYTNTKNYLYNNRWLDRQGGILHVAAAGATGGAIAGSLITFGSVPFELVKVRRQLEYSIAAAKGIVIVKPPNTWESVKDIFKTRGPMGLYTGWPLHMLRDTAGTALYFAEYDVMRHVFGRLPSGEQGPTPSWAPIHPSLVPFACGSFAGVSSWAIIYPLDVVKTKFQQRALAGESYRKPLTILHRLLRGPDPNSPKTLIQGFARIYRGLGVSASRSIITHGMLWTFVDAISNWIDGRTRYLNGTVPTIT